MGVQHYLQAIQTGRQQVAPAGPPLEVATFLAFTERRRVADADLWYVDADLCALLASAYPSMPSFAPTPADLPSERGFVVFAEPIAVAAQKGVDDALRALIPDVDGDPGFADRMAQIIAAGTQIVAASWGPITDVANQGWPAGGCFMTFYAESWVRTHRGDDPVLERAARNLPPLLPDNECAVRWYPDGADPAEYRLDPSPTSTDGWARLLLAAFRLAAQDNLADTSTVERAPRHERRRAARIDLPDRDVRIARLRPALRAAQAAEAPPGAGREWRHRWVVRGHWNPRIWRPDRRRPRWVAPYIKGPEGLPLLGGERVTVAGAPQPPAAGDGN